MRYWGYLPYQKTILKSSRCGSHPQYLNHEVYPSIKCNKFQKVVISRVDGVVGVQHFCIRNQEIVLVSSNFFRGCGENVGSGSCQCDIGVGSRIKNRSSKLPHAGCIQNPLVMQFVRQENETNSKNSQYRECVQ